MASTNKINKRGTNQQPTKISNIKNNTNQKINNTKVSKIISRQNNKHKINRQGRPQMKNVNLKVTIIYGIRISFF